jgi:alpha-N-arabinofuranosidase
MSGSLAGGLAALLPVSALAKASPAIKAVIDTGQAGEPITPYMYGALEEHIGGLINYSVWAEVLDDRKFYYPVDDQPVPGGSGSRGAGRKWTPLPGSRVTMDITAPYVGDHSPVVTADGGTPRGMQQMGLGLNAKAHVGRIVISGDPSASVTITLIWGDDAGDRQSVGVPVTAGWTTVPIRFDVKKKTAGGRIEIAGTGTGSFRVGAVSLMPDDNIQGFRADTIALLRDMQSGFWRVPGGNYVSSYDWRDTIGDPDKRPTTFDLAWHAPQPNDVGIDELLTLCRLIETEPYLCVNTGSGSAREAADLVEYVNGAPDTLMGRIRAANGHPAPYKVKYWNVGNEMYGYWQFGYMPPSQYMDKHNLFAKAMKKVDPTIVLVAIGAMPDEVTIDQVPYFMNPWPPRVEGKAVVEYGSSSDWTYRLIKSCYGNFDIISEHCYGDAHRFDIPQGRILDEEVQESVLDSCRRAPNRIRLKREYWDKYTQEFPQLLTDKIKVSVDEWGFRNVSGLRQTLGFAMTLHELFRNTDFITMAAFTMGTSWIDHNRTDAVYSNAGLLFRMYRQHFGTLPIAIGGNSPQPAPKWPVGGDQPAVNAGSPTFPLDMAAALTADRQSLTVAAVNATDQPQQTSLSFTGFHPASEGDVWRMTGSSLAAENRVGRPPEVAVKQAKFAGLSPNLTIAPYSIELYKFHRG